MSFGASSPYLQGALRIWRAGGIGCSHGRSQDRDRSAAASGDPAPLEKRVVGTRFGAAGPSRGFGQSPLLHRRERGGDEWPSPAAAAA